MTKSELVKLLEKLPDDARVVFSYDDMIFTDVFVNVVSTGGGAAELITLFWIDSNGLADNDIELNDDMVKLS